MGKLLTEMLDLNISDAVFSKNENTMLQTIDFSIRKKKQQTLTDCVRYFCKINAIENDLTGICFGFDNVVLNEELSNAKVRYIAQELAEAIDRNSVSRIKELKYEFGKDAEFITAKKFLNKKCKEIWNVFDSKDEKLEIPNEAMMSLGISNKPDLEFLLGDSVRFYEKDGSDTTGRIIASILNNKNLSYTINDIHNFLKKLHIKENCKYNLKTVSYFMQEHDYDEIKLKDLGICKDDIGKVFGSFTAGSKSKYVVKILKRKFADIYITLQNCTNRFVCFK